MILMLTEEEAATVCNALVAAEAVLCESLAHGHGDGRTLRDMMSDTRTLRERVERLVHAEHRRASMALLQLGPNQARLAYLTDSTRGHGELCPCDPCKELRQL
jgi:hypothetical protein